MRRTNNRQNPSSAAPWPFLSTSLQAGSAKTVGGLSPLSFNYLATRSDRQDIFWCIDDTRQRHFYLSSLILHFTFCFLNVVITVPTLVADFQTKYNYLNGVPVRHSSYQSINQSIDDDYMWYILTKMGLWLIFVLRVMLWQFCYSRPTCTSV